MMPAGYKEELDRLGEKAYHSTVKELMIGVSVGQINKRSDFRAHPIKTITDFSCNPRTANANGALHGGQQVLVMGKDEEIWDMVAKEKTLWSESANWRKPRVKTFTEIAAACLPRKRRWNKRDRRLARRAARLNGQNAKNSG